MVPSRLLSLMGEADAVARAVWKGAWRRCLPTLKVGENFPEEGHFIFGLVDK